MQSVIYVHALTHLCSTSVVHGHRLRLTLHVLLMRERQKTHQFFGGYILVNCSIMLLNQHRDGQAAVQPIISDGIRLEISPFGSTCGLECAGKMPDTQGTRRA